MAIVTPPTIDALPTPPDPNDRSTFNARAYPWSAAQQVFGTQMSAAASNVHGNALEAQASAIDAQASAESARVSVLDAQAIVQVATAIVDAEKWVSGSTYSEGAVVWSPVNYLSYRRKTAGGGTIDPSSDGANWAFLSASVMVAPALSGNTLAIVGQSYVLSMSATPGIAGTSIASFDVGLPDGTVQTVVATSNAGSYTWSVTGTVGQQKTFSVVAADSLGNKSATAQKTVTLANVYVNAPSITSPASGAVNIGSEPALATSSFAVTGGTDTHAATDWEIRTGANGAGTLIWSSANNSTNKTGVTVPTGTLSVSTTYYVRARHRGDTYGYGAWGESYFTTASSFVPTVAGTAYAGGFYAGRIVIGGSTYVLVVAPKSSGHSTSKQWKTTSDTTSGTSSLNDGLANSNAMNNSSHPAAQFCRALTIGGYSDWYLPAKDELEICYRNLKPTTDANNTSSGANTNSSPAGSAYTSGSPAQTSNTAFKTGGAEAFDSAYYWASTESSAATAGIQTFTAGTQNTGSKPGSYSVRAVRKVLI